MAARKLAEAGFYTLVYGNGSHPEVKGILGWAQATAWLPSRLRI